MFWFVGLIFCDCRRQAGLDNVSYQQRNQQMQNRLQKNIPIPNRTEEKYSGPQSPVGPPSGRRRRNPSFLTEKPEGPYGVVHDYHCKLNDEIDNLDNKVQKVLDKHEGQFVLAYRNHVKKVREEMEEIRKRATSNKDSSLGHFEKIQTLEKQLSIFRDQSLSLFDKITLRDLQLEQAKNRISELETEKRFNEDAIKALMKRNKYLEGAYLQPRPVQEQSLTLKPPSESTANMGRTGSISRGYTKDQKFEQRPYTTAIGNKQRSVSFRNRNNSFQMKPSKIQNISTEIRSILGIDNADHAERIIKLVNDHSTSLGHNCQTESAFVPKRKASGIMWHQSKELESLKSQSMFLRSELQDFLFTCIETVRKEIMRRKESRGLNFYVGQQLSLSEFKKIDSFRVLEMLVSHQSIIKGLHRIIFGGKDLLNN